MDSHLQEVYNQTADGGYFDFARCQRPNGTIYASPTDNCRKGTKIDDAEAPKKGRAARLSKNEKVAIKVMADKSLRSDKKRIAEMVRLGVPADTDFISLVADAKKKIGLGPEKTVRDSAAAKPERKMRLTAKIKAMSAADLKKVAADPRLSDRQREQLQKLIAAKEKESRKPDPKVVAEVAAIQAKVQARVKRQEGRAELRREVRQDANALALNPVYHGKTLETLSTLKSSYKMMQGLMKDPSFNTPANRARVINTRIAIWRTQKAIRESSATAKVDPKTYEKDLKNSPKYKSTPGSTKAISKAKAEDLPKLEKQMKALSAKLDKKGISQEEAMKISEEMLDLNRRLMVARGDSKPAAPNLKKIYEEQGFNAKPELVATANDLSKRKDLLTNPDGTNVILYRGVTTQEFSDQFKGLGPDGDTHFAGRGIFGNGSYAGAPAFHDPGGTAAAGMNVAATYAGERKNLASKVTAFGLRKDANVVTFDGSSYNERSRQYDQWMDDVRNRANAATGYRFDDVGEAAAAIGIHAYQVPQRDGDYYVVLNRGAVVAAMDSQLSDDTGR